MSESEARGLVKRFLDSFNDGDHEAMLELVSEDVAYDPHDGEREIGRERLRWRLGLASRHFDERLADIAIMTTEGGARAAAEFTVRGKYLATVEGLPEARGQSYTLLAGMFFDIDDGLLSRISACRNDGAWRSALVREW